MVFAGLGGRPDNLERQLHRLAHHDVHPPVAGQEREPPAAEGEDAHHTLRVQPQPEAPEPLGVRVRLVLPEAVCAGGAPCGSEKKVRTMIRWCFD